MSLFIEKELKESNISKYRKKALRNNKIAGIIISLGGYGVVLSITAILLFLIYEAVPLSFSAAIEEFSFFNSKNKNEKIMLAGLDRYVEVEYLVFENGIINFYSVSDGSLLKVEKLPLKLNEKILCADKGSLSNEIFSVVTDSSRLIVAEARMLPNYDRNKRVIVPELKIKSISNLSDEDDSKNRSIKLFKYSKNEDGNDFWAWVNDRNELFVKIFEAEEEVFYFHSLIDQVRDVEITSLAITQNGESLIVGENSGELLWFDISDYNEVKLKDNWKASASAVSAIDFLIGDNALALGTTAGEVQVWFPIRTKNNNFKFQRIHRFKSHDSAVSEIFVSSRNRSFISIDESNVLQLNYSTTSETQVKFTASANSITTASFSPKSDALIIADEQANIGIFKVDNDHPETTIDALFGKMWYEGYDSPEFVWQSTGGTDEFESKFSLIPLIFGTFKGTLYAMLFSVPLALFAAIYVSQFAPKKVARIIKPTIEIMAALPSVVIGFLAGLYFSPLFQEHLMTVLLIPVLIIIMFLVSVFVWKSIPEIKRVKFAKGTDLLFVLPFLVISFLLAAGVSNILELNLFDGNINQWMYEVLGINYDQRNSFVVGFALGFAVVPIIFTISEDSLSNVPQSLTSASFALGASPWQTVVRIVLPAAAGGIFSAIMLGLGRAIGETMIVLMATGNTPIMDLSPFNGFRAMSASIAVEIPEAPVDGTLYRVLFLTALLLFAFTFAINSVAALIGDRLRKKYARF